MVTGNNHYAIWKCWFKMSLIRCLIIWFHAYLCQHEGNTHTQPRMWESYVSSTVCFHPLVIPMADYYIIAGVVYQAPDLGTVISSRAVRISTMFLKNTLGIVYYKGCWRGILVRWLDRGLIVGELNLICCSSLLSMESSLLLMRPCHTAAITHPKDTGGTSRIRKKEVRLWQLI